MASPDLIPGGAPLDAVRGLNAAQTSTLRNLWISTAQQLVGVFGTNEPTRVRLANALQLHRTAIDGLVANAQRLIPPARPLRAPALENAAAAPDTPLGALLEDPAVTAERMAGLPPYVGALRTPLPPSHSLLDQLPPLRSQGLRPTCVAHAVLALREQLEIDAGASRDLDLSEQFVYWWCKARDGLPNRNGTYLSLGMRCLAEAGAPLEARWPYVATPSADPGQGPPPPAAAGGDPAFATVDTQEFNRADISGIKTCLVEGRSVACSFPVFDSWFKSSAQARWGLITLPLPLESAREGHAMALVGYQDDANAPGGGYFLVRNSWQPWAWDGTWRAGYGYIPYAYVSRFASTLFSARRPAGGRAFVRGEAAEDRPWLIVRSPDVWLRQSPDGQELPQEAVAGRENALYVRLHNAGPGYLYGITGEVYFKRSPASGWSRAGQFTQPALPPGASIVGPLAWLPPVAGHVSLAVKLE